ncbi:hypothetical protein PAL_GLEAN10020726 [Pteropus alecto]|uniref:Uncharacterized protein n=1 Tax=Pteropus alecto TaxID=9402 RepID=L5JNX3_PTEAL|nr:hypothetical protein PAL_GLEAN10020726 [Pteropus alecto]
MECKLRQEKTTTVRLCCHRHTQMSQNVVQSANSDICNRFVVHHLYSGLKNERKKCRAFKNKSEVSLSREDLSHPNDDEDVLCQCTDFTRDFATAFFISSLLYIAAPATDRSPPSHGELFGPRIEKSVWK